MYSIILCYCFLNNWKLTRYEILFKFLYIQCTAHTDVLSDLFDEHSKKDGKDQESIQSSMTPDPGHQMGKWQNQN